MYENQIALEEEKLKQDPTAEMQKLTEIYIAQGVNPDEAQTIAKDVMKRPETAYDIIIQHEL